MHRILFRLCSILLTSTLLSMPCISYTMQRSSCLLSRKTSLLTQANAYHLAECMLKSNDSTTFDKKLFASLVKEITDKKSVFALIRIMFNKCEKKSDLEEQYAPVLADILDQTDVSANSYIPLLHSAAYYDLPRMIELLLNRNINPNNPCSDFYLDSDRTVIKPSIIALHCAKSASIAQKLIDHGSNVNAQYEAGPTPLHTCGNKAISTILQAGAKSNIGSYAGLLIISDLIGHPHYASHFSYEKNLWQLHDKYPGTLEISPIGHYGHAEALHCARLTPAGDATWNGNQARLNILLEHSPRAETLDQLKTLQMLAEAQLYRTENVKYFPILEQLRSIENKQ